jgi:rod shape-determining protein MreD
MWIIALSLVIALMLTALPLPEWAVNWRPAWVAMVLIYWCMALPERVGIGVRWGSR